MRPSLLGWIALVAGLVACTPRPERGALPGDGTPGESGAAGGGEGGDGEDGDGGGGPATPSCSSWEGPFGSLPGDTIDPDLRWEGFAPGAIEAGELELGDELVCGGADEVTALVIYIDALWCSVCRQVADTLAETYEARWKDRGVRVVSLVVEDESGSPADLEDGWIWRDTFGLENMPVAIDPAYALQNDAPATLPQAIVVDPRTLRVVERAVGDVDLEPLLDDMIARAAE